MQGGKKQTKSRKSSKSGAAPYKRTSRKVTIKGKSCTVYLRVKDSVECVRRRNKAGKVVFRKVSSYSKNGGCGCAAKMNLSGGKSKAPKQQGGEVTSSLKSLLHSITGGANANASVNTTFVEPTSQFEMSAPVQEAGAQRLDKNKKTTLYKKARKYAIKGRSKMTKQQLVTAVRAAQRALGDRIRRRRSSKHRSPRA